MTTYTARFRTEAEYAVHEFEADTPEQALQMARAFVADHGEDLMFVGYDDNMPLDEIVIEGPEGTERALWESDHLRLRLAASELLEALTYFRNMASDWPSSVRKGYVQQAFAKADAAIAKATPNEQAG